MQHKSITGTDVHVVHAWTYADTTARAAATGFVAGDVGRVALQSDNSSFWFLSDHDPITWVQVGTGAAPGTHNHNDIYFTETEVTDALALKSDSTHNHDAAYAAAGHNHDAAYAAIGHSHTLDGLSDVAITSPSNGQVLKHNGTNWVNDTDATGGGGGSSPTASVRQTVLSGAVDSNGFPNFLSAGTGLAVNLAATLTTVVLAFAAGFDTSSPYGPLDYFERITADVTGAWSGLTANATNYLYREKGVGYGAIVIAPGYGTVAPTADITPVMTANNAPSPYVVSASSEFSSTYAPWKAVDGDSSTHGWVGTAIPGWWQIDWGAAAYVSSYTVVGGLSDAGYSPKDWTLLGSDTGAFAGEETTLDTQSGQTAWGLGEARNFTVSNPGAYRYLRFKATATVAGGGEMHITKFAFIGLATGQHWFDLSTMQMKRWSGSAWETKQRVFVGEAVTDGSGVTSVVSYALRGEYVPARFTVAASTNITKSHNIGTDKIIVQPQVATSAGGDLTAVLPNTITRNAVTFASGAGAVEAQVMARRVF